MQMKNFIIDSLAGMKDQLLNLVCHSENYYVINEDKSNILLYNEIATEFTSIVKLIVSSLVNQIE